MEPPQVIEGRYVNETDLRSFLQQNFAQGTWNYKVSLAIYMLIHLMLT